MKSLLVALLFPFQASVLVLLAGVLFLWFGKNNAARIFLTLGTCLMILLGTSFVSHPVARALEYRFPPLSDEKLDAEAKGVRYVVVLAGSFVDDPSLPLTSQLKGATLSRALEGARLHRKIPGSKLVLSGGGKQRLPVAAVIPQLLTSLGLDPQDLILETQSQNTYEEVLNLKNLLGSERFVLVTSAIHMPRAMALFQKSGLHPVPAPTDHRTTRTSPGWMGSLFLSIQNIQTLESVVYECLGVLKEGLLGRT